MSTFSTIGSISILSSYEYDVPDGAREPAAQKARLLNDEYREAILKDRVNARFAKAVCCLNEEGLLRWHVKVTYLQTQQELKGATERNPALVELADKIYEAITLICKFKAGLVIEPETKVRQLIKTVVYLLQTPQWPVTNPTIEVAQTWFSDFALRRLDPKDYECKIFISDLKSRLHLQVLGLRDVSVKITTKAALSKEKKTSALKCNDAIQKLIQAGLELIKSSQVSSTDIDLFTRVVVHHIYVYIAEVNKKKADLKLVLMFNGLVEALIQYEDKYEQSKPLLNFTYKLMGMILSRANEQGSFSEQLTDLQQFQDIVFETLMHNEGYIRYLKCKKKDEQLLNIMHELFAKNVNYPSVAGLSVFLGNSDLFQKFLETGFNVSKKYRLDQRQINRVFLNLNEKLHKFPGEKSFEEMYKMFLDILSKVNCLHFLEGFAKRSENSAMLKDNLHTLGYTFMGVPQEGNIPLEAFFGNATYRALKVTYGSPIVQRACVRLFRKSCDNPIINETEFDAALETILTLFDGFELLTAQIFGTMGEVIWPGKERSGSLIEWLSNVMEHCQFLKESILKCFLSNLEETHFNNKVNRLCWHEETLYKIEHIDKDDFILKNFMTGEPREIPQTVWVSDVDVVDPVQEALKKEMLSKESRDAVANLTTAYMLLNEADDNIKTNVKQLLSVIFRKMKGDTLVKFHDRMTIIATCVNAVAPFLKTMKGLVGTRFFNKEGILNHKLAMNLKQQAEKIIPAVNVGRVLPELSEANPVSLGSLLGLMVRGELSQLFFSLILQEIENSRPLHALLEVTSELNNIIIRKVDELAYPMNTQGVSCNAAVPINESHVGEMCGGNYFDESKR